jgi:hypothetical protein
MGSGFYLLKRVHGGVRLGRPMRREQAFVCVYASTCSPHIVLLLEVGSQAHYPRVLAYPAAAAWAGAFISRHWVYFSQRKCNTLRQKAAAFSSQCYQESNPHTYIHLLVLRQTHVT